MITIVHRLKTAMDYGGILVLDEGRIFEFDTSWALLQTPIQNGAFREMCWNSVLDWPLKEQVFKQDFRVNNIII